MSDEKKFPAYQIYASEENEKLIMVLTTSLYPHYLDASGNGAAAMEAALSRAEDIFAKVKKRSAEVNE